MDMMALSCTEEYSTNKIQIKEEGERSEKRREKNESKKIREMEPNAERYTPEGVVYQTREAVKKEASSIQTENALMIESSIRCCHGSLIQELVARKKLSGNKKITHKELVNSSRDIVRYESMDPFDEITMANWNAPF